MTAIARTLDAKLKQWRPATARKVARQVATIIKLAEQSSKSPPPQRKNSRRHTNDPLLLDQKLFSGSTPADLSSRHDHYLYGN